MGAAKLMFLVVAVAIMLLGATAVFGYSTYEGGDETTVVNETFQPADNQTIQLENSNLSNTLYSTDVNVTNTSDTVVFEPDGNYTWNDGNGTIFVEGNSPLANETDAHITYSFSETNQEAYGMMTLFASITDFADSLVLVLAVGAVLAAARVFGGAG